MSPTDPPTDSRVEALARDTERVSRRVDEHDEKLGEFDGMLSGLAGDVARLVEVTSARPQSWLQVSDPEIARAMLTDLVEWLDSVYLRYTAVQLPTCWAWHPDVVEELWWLRCAHGEAYSGRGWASRAGMWHHQYRPAVVERIRSAIGTCDLQQHVSGGQKAKPPIAAPLAGHLVEVAEAWTATGLPPEPTAEQLAHAREYDDQDLHRPPT